MDIKVITRHGPSNYGSLLQSIATIEIIERLGHQCQIIDYQRDDERGLQAVLAALHKKTEWSDHFLKKLAYIITRLPVEYWAQRKFDSLRAKYLKLTTRCRNIEELRQFQADVFITGSDQVWGPILTQKYDEAYFLSFVGTNSKKIAYAASFGRTNFDDEIVDAYKHLLSQYDEIAVRESSAVNLLKEWEIPCIGQVLDPTLLLTAEEWAKYIKTNISGKYVLIYQLHNNDALNKYAKAFANKVGLPIFRISPSFHQLKRGGKFIYLPELGEFLSYIKNCTYFVTDSFHGTAFALNFNKQFIEILPNNKTGSRNQSILQLTGLEDRIITNFDDYSIANKFIDYKSVNEILRVEKENSIKILKELCTRKIIV